TLNMAPQLADLAPDVLAALHAKVPGMLRWLSAMRHPDGEIALLNDSAMEPLTRGQFLADWANAMGIGTPSSSERVIHLAETGYVVLRSHDGQNYAVIDVGEIGPAYQPAHAHCDLLSFELSLFGHRVITDTGVGGYDSLEMRALDRGTAAHNTAIVASEEQSEIWSRFRVGRRAHPRAVAVASREDGSVLVAAEHTGYDRLGIRHKRQFIWNAHSLDIRDSFAGRRSQAVVVHLHFHPDVHLQALGHSAFNLSLPWKGPSIRLEIDTGVAELTETPYHEEFGKERLRPALRIRLAPGATELRCNLAWTPEECPTPPAT
ncbi:MAG: heparinase II/III family protein, partial [Cyanobacteria bacterium REEB65]|nr:heparinase II/III family protein [Cyanobacteria bacterium REEB65]